MRLSQAGSPYVKRWREFGKTAAVTFPVKSMWLSSPRIGASILVGWSSKIIRSVWGWRPACPRFDAVTPKNRDQNTVEPALTSTVYRGSSSAADFPLDCLNRLHDADQPPKSFVVAAALPAIRKSADYLQVSGLVVPIAINPSREQSISASSYSPSYWSGSPVIAHRPSCSSRRSSDTFRVAAAMQTGALCSLSFEEPADRRARYGVTCCHSHPRSGASFTLNIVYNAVLSARLFAVEFQSARGGQMRSPVLYRTCCDLPRCRSPAQSPRAACRGRDRAPAA